MEGRRYRTPKKDALTERQRQVLALVARGYTNGQIAESLGITLDGAKWHVSEIIAHFGVSTREEAVEAWRAEASMSAKLRRAMAPLTAARWGSWAAGTLAVLAVATVGWFFTATLRGEDRDGGRQDAVSVDPGLTPAGEPEICPVDPYAREPAAIVTFEGASCPGVVDSDLVGVGIALTCRKDVEALSADFSFRIHTPPENLDAELVQAAVLSTTNGPAAYTAYRVGDRVLEMLEGPVTLPGLDYRSLQLAIGGASDGVFDWGENGIILDWCPTLGLPADGGGYDCSGGIHLLMTGLPMTDIAKAAFDIAQPTTPDGNPTPVPYPAPRGEHADPRVADAPVYPGAVEVDGFETEGLGVTWSVQVFETADYPEQVMRFYRDALGRAGWDPQGLGASPAGYSLTWVAPPGSQGVINLETGYVARPGEEANPPPGFRGKGVPFDDRLGCATRFAVLTR